MELTKAFADVVRTNPFNGSLTEGQVAGMEVIFTAWSAPKYVENDMRWLAYIFATAYWETSRTMQPVIETFDPAYDTVNPSVETAIARLEAAFSAGHLPWVHIPYWRKDVNGMSWLGRGYPQVTHKENYLKAEAQTGIKFTSDPALMLVPDNAVIVMFDGMINGWFSGKKLGDYFSTRVSDPVGARHIINGTDHASDIANIYTQFFRALLQGARAA